MSLNGIHHLAVSTTDIKKQVSFFTEVLGLEMVALYWMHGVPDTWHGFIKLNDLCYLAFVQGPKNVEGEVALGSSHAANSGGPSAGGTMQHLSFNVDNLEELLEMRDRIRAHGVPVFGPLDHGLCHSIYFAGPEGLNLEVATSEQAIDRRAWIDPEVAALAGMTPEEVSRYSAPKAKLAVEGRVPQPEYDPEKPHMVFPQEVYLKLLQMPDEEYGRRFSESAAPVATD